jgi:uncharacterized protein (DUF488 family)
MLFDRQRVLLELLDALNEPVGSTDFQKLLFLYTREGESTPSYEFVPYRFGCFSFTSYADKRRLIEQGLLDEDEQAWKLTEKGRRMARGGERSPLLMARFAKQYKSLRGNALVADVYQRYPYFATRSEIVEKVLPKKEDRVRVEAARPAKQTPGLVTLGYESKTLEAYLNQLLKDGVTLLCDVRRNPLSRKYGFSKSTLSHACEGVGIRYEHLPELGIPSEKRQDLETQTDYDKLFATYERQTFPKQTKTLIKIASWIKEEGQRVALTCFELLPHQCHRHCVADALQKTFGSKLAAHHI